MIERSGDALRIVAERPFDGLVKHFGAVAGAFGDACPGELGEFVVGKDRVYLIGKAAFELSDAQEHAVAEIHAIDEILAVDEFVEVNVVVFGAVEPGVFKYLLEMQWVIVEVAGCDESALGG